MEVDFNNIHNLAHNLHPLPHPPGHMFPQGSNFMIAGGHFTSVHGDYHYNVDNHNGLHVLSQWIAHAAMFDSCERFPPGKCHPGTRERVIEMIKEWIIDPAPERQVAWLYGPAGAGKSAIAQTIAELLWEHYRAHYGGCFFFKAEDSLGRGDGNKLFSTLAYQLAVQFPSLMPFINDALLKDPTLPSKSMDVQIQKLIIGPILQTASWPTHTPTIIIDGPDECADSTIQTKILSIISDSILSHNLPVRFLIASHPEYWIRDAFEVGHLHGISRPISLNKVGNAYRDIETYLLNEFSKICQKYSRIMSLVECPWPEHRIIERFVKEASGQFIYASTIIKFIGYSSDFCDPREQLRILLTSGPHRAAAFSNLDKLYATILSRIPDSHQAALKMVLGGVILGLTVQVIESFLGVDHSQMSLILNFLSPLIDLYHEKYRSEDCLKHLYGPSGVPERTRIRFCHLSFKEFLHNEIRSGQYFVDQTGVGEQFWCTIISLLGSVLQQNGEFEKHQTYSMNFWCFRHMIHSIVGIPTSPKIFNLINHDLRLKIQAFTASNSSHIPCSLHLLQFLNILKGQMHEDPRLISLAQSKIFGHLIDRNMDTFGPTLYYAANHTFMEVGRYHQLPEVHVVQEMEHGLLDIQWEYRKFARGCRALHPHLTIADWSHVYAYIKKDRGRLAQWHKQSMWYMCFCLALLINDGAIFCKNPSDPRLISRSDVQTRRQILQNFFEHATSWEPGVLGNAYVKLFLVLLTDPRAWNAFCSRLVLGTWDVDRVTYFAMRWMQLLLNDPESKSAITAHDPELPNRMSQTIVKLFDQHFLPSCQHNWCLNKLIVFDSLYFPNIAVILKLKLPLDYSRVVNLEEKDIPPPDHDLAFFTVIGHFHSMFCGRYHSLIDRSRWYPYMAAYCLTSQVRYHYSILHPQFHPHVAHDLAIHFYLIDVLPYALPTEQNLTSFRALRLLSLHLPEPWHPPTGFCSEAAKLLKKYHESALPVAELTGFMDWLAALVESDSDFNESDSDSEDNEDAMVEMEDFPS